MASQWKTKSTLSRVGTGHKFRPRKRGLCSLVGVEAAAPTPIVPTIGMLYAVAYVAPGIVVKIDPETFQRLGAVNLPSGEDNSFPLALTSTDLYVGLEMSPGKIAKIDLATFTETTVLTLSDLVNCDSLVADETNGFLYVFGYSGSTFDPAVAKIQLSDFTEVTQTAVTGYAYGNRSVISGGYLYLATDAPGISKVNLTTFTEETHLSLSSLVYNVVVAGDYLYTVLVTDPAVVKKIRLSDFTEENSLTLNVGDANNTYFGLCIPENSNKLYIMCSLGVIVEIDLTTFTRTASLDLGLANDLDGVLADSVYLYGIEWSSPIVVHRIQVSDLTEIDTLTLDTGEDFAGDLQGVFNTAEFLTISASVGTGSGTISPSGDVDVAPGADQAFTITPAAGYYISDVLVDDVSQGMISTYTFTNVLRNHTIVVNFTLIPVGEQITNGDFENGTTGWTNLEGPASALTTEYAHSPTHSAFTYSDAIGFYQDIADVPTDYVTSLTVYLACVGDSAENLVIIRFTDSTTVTFQVPNTGLPAGTFAQSDLTSLLPAGKIINRITLQSGTGYPYYADDVSLISGA